MFVIILGTVGDKQFYPKIQKKGGGEKEHTTQESRFNLFLRQFNMNYFASSFTCHGFNFFSTEMRQL